MIFCQHDHGDLAKFVDSPMNNRLPSPMMGIQRKDYLRFIKWEYGGPWRRQYQLLRVGAGENTHSPAPNRSTPKPAVIRGFFWKTSHGEFVHGGPEWGTTTI